MKSLFLLSVLLVTSAFAESRIVAKMSGVEMQEKGLLLEFLKLGCRDPGAVHNQMPPSDIKVFCHEEFCKWELGPSTFQTKTNDKSVCGKIMTNKPNLGTLNKCNACSSTPTTFSLPTLVEKCGHFTTIYQVTCDQVLAMTSVEGFCLNTVDAEIAVDATIIDWKPSGKTQTAVMGPEMTGKTLTQK